MTYRNGKDLLPSDLLSLIQQYIEGEIIYIPRKTENRAGWGEVNGTRLKMRRRNLEILRLYRSGMTVEELAEKFHLSDYSIRKVIGRKDLWAACTELEMQETQCIKV